MLNDFNIIDFCVASKEPITIVPLGDAHYGAREFNEARWNETIRRIKDDPFCYSVIVGDLIDNGLKNSVTNVYEQTAMPGEQKRWLLNALEPIKDKILAGVGGNHESRTKKDADTDPMYDVFCKLGIEDKYRSRIAFLNVRFIPDDGSKRSERGTARTSFAIAVTHGAGGGMYVGSGANKTAMFGAHIDGIDILITGHTHKPMAFPVSKLVFDSFNSMVRQAQFTVVTASSFLDYGGYPVERLLTPTGKTLTEIRLFFNHDGKKTVRVTQ